MLMGETSKEVLVHEENLRLDTEGARSGKSGADVKFLELKMKMESMGGLDKESEGGGGWCRTFRGMRF